MPSFYNRTSNIEHLMTGPKGNTEFRFPELDRRYSTRPNLNLGSTYLLNSLAIQLYHSGEFTGTPQFVKT